MADFTTVFEINRWSNGLLADELFRLAIGIVALLGGLTGMFFAWRRRKTATPRRSPGSYFFIIAWAVIWLVLHNFPAMYQRIDHLTTAYETGHCETAEGTVSVKHEQPEH